MTYKIAHAFPDPMLLSNEGTCISLYQKTHRHRPEKQQNLIRFKNLVKEIEQSLGIKYDKKTIEKKMKAFYDLEQDRPFWEHVADGLAIFASEDQCIIYRLQRPVNELAMVADSFHIKPLIRIFQSADRYHLLTLDQKEFSLFEGTRYQLEEVELDPQISSTITDALGDDYGEKLLIIGGSGPRGQAVFHGFGSKKDVIDKETEKFFRIVDEEVLTYYSQTSKIPLYLVALDENQSSFRKISKNKYLQKEGIKVSSQSMDIESLKKAAWEAMEESYLEKTRLLVEKFENARSQDKGSDDIAQVVRAATENKISHLLLESDRVIAGSIDLETGNLLDANIEDPHIDDVLDDLAELVFKQQGEVLVLPKERMPSSTGLAAIYRY